MIWNSYEAYCAEMRRFKTEPLGEEIWRREYGPKQQVYEPMVLTPRKTVRVKPTLANHIDPIRREDFRSADDYFDALEVARLIKTMRG